MTSRASNSRAESPPTAGDKATTSNFIELPKNEMRETIVTTV